VRDEGYYWIKRAEPDGPPKWEPALFRHRHYEVGVLNARNLGPCWYVIGSDTPKIEITKQGASNQWVVGERIER
jgi:hypothetical protein